MLEENPPQSNIHTSRPCRKKTRLGERARGGNLGEPVFERGQREAARSQQDASTEGEERGESDLSKSVPDARKGFDAPVNLRFT